MSPSEPHDEFLELCAVSTSGQLTEEEQKKLQEHLAVCQSCRKTLRQYETVVREAIPAIAAEKENDLENVDWTPWSPSEEAEKMFFLRLAREETVTSKALDSAKRVSHVDDSLSLVVLPWRHVWMLYAAGILLFATLGLYSYRLMIQRPLEGVRQSATEPSGQSQKLLQEQLSDSGHDSQVAHAQLEQRNKIIADLQRQLAHQSVEINQLQATQDREQQDLRASNHNQEELVQQGRDLAQKLAKAESNSRGLQEKVDLLTLESGKDASREQALQAKANDLTQLLQDREVSLERQEQLLAHDRDIRDLMGARDLYIAEVYDVARTGETKKPYGRVFYTRGKSLIFYAYDLDQQSEAKKAKTFQVWGRRGPDQQQALNLGVFFEDNAAKKRWILKCDDSNMLSQIDGVFVTVEPLGGSHRPSGKSLLFASLRINPNHP